MSKQSQIIKLITQYLNDSTSRQQKLQTFSECVIDYLKRYGEISSNDMRSVFSQFFASQFDDDMSLHRLFIIGIQKILVGTKYVVMYVPELEKYVMKSWNELFPHYFNSRTFTIFDEDVPGLSQFTFDDCRSFVAKDVFSQKSTNSAVQNVSLMMHPCRS